MFKKIILLPVFWFLMSSNVSAMMGFPPHIQAFEQMKVKDETPLSKEDVQKCMNVPYAFVMYRLFPSKIGKKLYKKGFKQAYERLGGDGYLETFVKEGIAYSGVKTALESEAQKRGFKTALEYIVKMRRFTAALKAIDATEQLKTETSSSMKRILKKRIDVAIEADTAQIRPLLTEIYLKQKMHR